MAAAPPVVGRLPTTTQPERSATSAVVSPTPPGHGPGSEAAFSSANTLSYPPGAICTMVVPVPWMLETALKLLTSTLPRVNMPAVAGTTAMP